MTGPKLLEDPHLLATTTTILLIAGAGLLQGKLGCKRRKDGRPLTPSNSEAGNTCSKIHEKRRPPLSADAEEAERCWANSYGRFKFCGLRENPTADIPPPTYSLVPLNLPIPVLSADQAATLEIFTRNVQDLADAGARVDQATLLRYLRAKKFQLQKAETLFRKAMQWRKDNDLDRIATHWDLEAYERTLAPWWLSGGIIGVGLQGQPVALERIGRCKWPHMCDALPFEVLQKLDAVHCMRCLAAVEEDSLRRGVPFTGTTLVVDLHGFGWDQAQPRAAYMLSQMTTARTLIMPETVKELLFIRTPQAFVYAWSAFGHLLDPNTKHKVQMATEADTLPLLRKYLRDDQIPGYLGGSFCHNGDPECRQVLAPGGFPPEAALNRLRHLLATANQRPERPARLQTASQQDRQQDDADEQVDSRRGNTFCGVNVCWGG